MISDDRECHVSTDTLLGEIIKDFFKFICVRSFTMEILAVLMELIKKEHYTDSPTHKSCKDISLVHMQTTEMKAQMTKNPVHRI